MILRWDKSCEIGCIGVFGFKGCINFVNREWGDEVDEILAMCESTNRRGIDEGDVGFAHAVN